MNGNIPRMDVPEPVPGKPAALCTECCNYDSGNCLTGLEDRRALRVCTEYQLFAALPLVYRRCPAA